MIKIWNRQNRYVKYLLYIYNLWGNTNRFSNKNIHNLLNINCCYPCHICKIANFNNSKPLSETSWAKILVEKVEYNNIRGVALKSIFTNKMECFLCIGFTIIFDIRATPLLGYF